MKEEEEEEEEIGKGQRCVLCFCVSGSLIPRILYSFTIPYADVPSPFPFPHGGVYFSGISKLASLNGTYLSFWSILVSVLWIFVFDKAHNLYQNRCERAAFASLL